MNKLKGVALALVIGLALTGLTYLYATPIPVFAENDPFFWYYSVLSVQETAESTPAVLHGFPFSYVLESESVFILGLFSFILDFIVYLIIGILIFWLFLSGEDMKITSLLNRTNATKKYPRK